MTINILRDTRDLGSCGDGPVFVDANFKDLLSISSPLSRAACAATNCIPKDRFVNTYHPGTSTDHGLDEASKTHDVALVVVNSID